MTPLSLQLGFSVWVVVGRGNVELRRCLASTRAQAIAALQPQREEFVTSRVSRQVGEATSVVRALTEPPTICSACLRKVEHDEPMNAKRTRHQSCERQQRKASARHRRKLAAGALDPHAVKRGAAGRPRYRSGDRLGRLAIGQAAIRRGIEQRAARRRERKVAS